MESGGEHYVQKQFKEKKMKKLMVIIASLAMITSSAYAADWNFYGSARMSTFINDVDANVAGTEDTTNIAFAQQGNSRLGANVKVNDELTGRFEFGIADGGVSKRLIYGEWDFGGGKFLVGRTYSPLNMFYSNQVYGSDNDLLNYGGVYAGRQDMLRLTFGNFKIALIAPDSAGIVVGEVDGAATVSALGVVVPAVPAVAATATTAAVAAVPAVPASAFLAPNLETDDFTAIEQVLPKIEASYKLTFDNMHVNFQGGYNTYELSNGAGTTVDVDSYVLALGAGIKFGAAYLQGNIWMGQNVGPYGLYNAPADDPAIGANGVSLVDNDALGYLVVAGYKVNDMFSLEVGYAHAEAELDVAGSTEDEVDSYYVQTTVSLAPGVFFVPEIGYIDNVEAGTTETLYYGMKWQINF